MKIRKIILVVTFLVSQGTASFADQESEANRLFVRSAQLWDHYLELPEEDMEFLQERLEILTKIDSNLNSLVDEFPESSLAVQLVAFGGYGIISLEDIALQMSIVSENSVCERDIAICPLIFEALGVAKGIREVEESVVAFSSLAEVQIEAGYRYYAQASIQLALESASKFNDYDYDERSAISSIVSVQALLGDISGAVKTAQMLEEEEKSISIAIGQTKAGDVNAALHTVRFFDYEALPLALNQIASAQAAMGDIAGALETSEQIRFSPILSVQSLVEIANYQMRKGNTSGALSTIQQALNLQKSRKISLNAYLYSAIAKIQARAGDVLGAKKSASIGYAVAMAENDEYTRAFSLAHVAGARAASGQLEEAISIAQDFKISGEEFKHDYALSEIAIAQAFLGDFSSATESAKELTSRRYETLSSISISQAESGLFSEAIETARTIYDPSLAVAAFVGIIGAMP